MNSTITISSKILENMFVSEYNYEKIGTFIDPEGKFTGWHIEANYESGEYMSSKSSMVDFEVHLYRPWKDGDEGESDESVYVGTAIGGYYNEHTGYRFNYDLEFLPPEPETPESKFREFLLEVANDKLSIDKMIKKIEKRIKEDKK